MNVFWHDDVASNNEVVFDSQLFENLQEEISPSYWSEELPPAIATTGDEMPVTAAMYSAQAFGHGRPF
jgi:hypothetical protein